MQRFGALARLRDRTFFGKGNNMERMGDIMAVLGLSAVFVGLAVFIACWG